MTAVFRAVFRAVRPTLSLAGIALGGYFAASALTGCVRHTQSNPVASGSSDADLAVPFRRAAAPGELVVVLRYHPRKGYRLLEARWSIDGRQVSELSGAGSEDLEVYRGRLPSGPHQVSVVLNATSPANGALLSRVSRSTDITLSAEVGACAVSEVFHSERELATGTGQATFVVWRNECRTSQSRSTQ